MHFAYDLVFCKALRLACFEAGTPIRTADGSKPIETLRSYEAHGDECDRVLSRSEFDPREPVTARRVLRAFVRVSPVLDVVVEGRVIPTTGEHPFWLVGRGWTPASELAAGDVLLSGDGQELPVSAVLGTGRVATVYNVEVEGDHTYFVGGDDWGFDIWVHNAKAYNLNTNSAISRFGIYEINVNGMLHKIGKADLNRITKSSGLPTRLHHQIRRLERTFGKANVSHTLTELGTTTTRAAKAAETAVLRSILDRLRIIPLGNRGSFFP